MRTAFLEEDDYPNNKRSKWSNLVPGPECWKAKQATRLQEWFW